VNSINRTTSPEEVATKPTGAIIENILSFKEEDEIDIEIEMMKR
jgi:hypothetical protein